MNIKSEEIKKILVIKFGGIGDVLLSTAVLENLKDYFRKSEINFLTVPSARDVVEGNPYVSRVLTFDLYKDDSIRLIKKVRKERYDMIIDLFTNPRSNLVCFLSGAKYRVGYDFPHRNFGYNIKVKARARGGEMHNLDFNLLALESIGVPVISKEQNIYTDNVHVDFAENFLRQNDISEKKLIGIIISGGWETKKYKSDDYITLIKMLKKEFNTNIILMWGTEDELSECKKIKSEIGDAFIAPPSGLKYLAALINKCSAVICNDSGPMHITNAMKVPLLAIFGPTNPGLQGPYSEKNLTIVNENINCLGCQLLECKIGNICMTQLSKEKIISEFRKLIQINGIQI